MPWTFLGQVFDRVWSRDGLWAVVALALASVMAYTYFFEVSVIKDRLDGIDMQLIRACVRSGVKPVDACWTYAPK